jgi:hypothetical protein
MSDISFLEGRRLPAAWPFGLASFAVVSILGLCAIVIDVYLIYRYWQTAPENLILILSVSIGVQLAYQWWRVIRYRTKIRQIYPKDSNSGSPLDLVVRVAAGGMIDVLFFSYGITIVALILIGFLLSKISHA